VKVNKDSLINALGKSKKSAEVNTLKKSFGSFFIDDDFSLSGECYLLCREKGVSLTFKDDFLSSIHLRFDGEDNYDMYKGWISDYFDNEKQSFKNTIKLIGQPASSGGGTEGFMGAIDAFWLRYDYGNHSIHYTFTEDKSSISLVTIMVN
jgi:hypothetical protein